MQILNEMNVDECVVVEADDLSGYVQVSAFEEGVAACMKKTDMADYVQHVPGYNVFGGDNLYVEIKKDSGAAEQSIAGKYAQLNIKGTELASMAVTLPAESVSSTACESFCKTAVKPGIIESGVIGTDGKYKTAKAALPAETGTILLDTTAVSAVTQEFADAIWPYLSAKVVGILG